MSISDRSSLIRLSLHTLMAFITGTLERQTRSATDRSTSGQSELHWAGSLLKSRQQKGGEHKRRCLFRNGKFPRPISWNACLEVFCSFFDSLCREKLQLMNSSNTARRDVSVSAVHPASVAQKEYIDFNLAILKEQIVSHSQSNWFIHIKHIRMQIKNFSYKSFQQL